MSLFVIGDLHLSFGVDKPMDVFGGWENHVELLKEAWLSEISAEDTVVLAGDTSWGMTLDEALPDFRWIDALPGEKIILKGNHDYWWTTMSKMTAFLEKNELHSLHILHNNHYAYEKYGICGTRGWVNIEPNEPANAKVNAREAQRLEVSVQSALAAGLTPIVFLHYPPIFADNCNYEILQVLWKYQIADCWYGHLHGSGSHRYAICGERDDVCYHLISGDYIQFCPQKVL